MRASQGVKRIAACAAAGRIERRTLHAASGEVACRATEFAFLGAADATHTPTGRDGFLWTWGATTGVIFDAVVAGQLVAAVSRGDLVEIEPCRALDAIMGLESRDDPFAPERMRQLWSARRARDGGGA